MPGLNSFLAVALSLAGLTPALGDDSDIPRESPPGKLFVGTIAQVQPDERLLKMDAFWGPRTFSVSDTCQVSLEDKAVAKLADLSPGQRVRIRYLESHGVKIANAIEQQNLVHHGRIEFIDTPHKVLGVEHSMVTRRFALPDNVAVVVHDNQAGTLDDLKVGQRVDVIYETPGDPRYVARRIEQKLPTFVGTIRSLDATTRLVKARNLFDEKQFRLADDCQIVTGDKSHAALQDLRIGDRVEFVYEEKAGVLIASRIGQDSSAAAKVGSDTATASTHTSR